MKAVLTTLTIALVAIALHLTHPPHAERPAAVATQDHPALWAGFTDSPLPPDLEEPPNASPALEPVEISAPLASSPPTGSPPVEPAPRAGASETPSCEWADTIRAVWAGTGDEDWAVMVAVRESGPTCSTTARNASGASGIFQLMMPLHRQLVADVCGGDPDSLVFDGDCNIRAARVLYDRAGRSPWAF